MLISIKKYVEIYHFSGSYKPRMLFFLLINAKMTTIVQEKLCAGKIPCSVELSMKNTFITSRPELIVFLFYYITYSNF